MSNILILNKSFVSVGLTTLTYTVPTTANYNIRVQAQVPESVATGFGAGSGADQGDGATGGKGGANQALQTTSNGQTGLGSSFPNVPANSAPGVDPTTPAEGTPNLPSIALGSGAQGLGFGTAAVSDDATGVNGHGNGLGGGTLGGFSEGGSTGAGAVGQGFGVDTSGYNQPSPLVTTPTTTAGLASALVILVKNNGSTVFTAPVLTPTQSAMQFKFSTPLTAADVVTITFTSANASDNTYNGVQVTASIGQGL